jgi:hypothetical protein
LKTTRSYVIRIYRRDADTFSGLVEDVQTSRVAAFQCFTELCDLLAERKPFPRRRRSDSDSSTTSPETPT